MNIPENNFINKILAIVIIILLTLSDFLFVGNSLVSYALDAQITNNQNIEFMAYFLNSTGERVDRIEQNIDKETKLFIDVSVKQEGYFNGKIVLNDSNFAFKLGQENEYIANITEDTVLLNQVNAGSTLSLELVIVPKVSSRINEQILSCDTKVVLQGNYINSKNVETNSGTEITGIDVVNLFWKSSEETKAELESKILTNFVYQENEEEKRIVQVLVNSNITENNYPVKNNCLAISVPENVQSVKVHTRSTDSTNSNINFNEDNYQYDEQKKILKINLVNNDTNNICWNKNAKDTFVVTYTFAKEENLQNKEIVVANLINTYDDKNLTAKQSVILEKEIDGIVSSEVQNTEEIYKGKIYTGEEREYNVKTVVNVDYLNVLDKMDIILKESTFVKNEDEVNSNIIYKSTQISKDEFLKIFGEDGYITVKDETGAVIANINKNTPSDENGKIVINYLNLVKSVNMVTSKPVNMGAFNLENTKAVVDSGLTREEIDTLTAIKESIAINQNEVHNLIVLKETESQATLKVNPTTILASEEIEQMEIEATLLANDESKDLYKNPKVTFVFPSELEIESAKFATLYKNGLEVESTTTGKNENGEEIIEINFKGEQLKYEYTGGTVIRIKAQVKANKNVESKNVAVQMIYTNENKNQIKQSSSEVFIEAEEKEAEENTVQINNEEIPEMLTTSQILRTPRLSTNASIFSNETEEKINVSIVAVSANNNLEENEDVYEGQTIKYEITVTNNTGKDYSNVDINAVQKNGYVWDLYEEEIINYDSSSEPVMEHFYDCKESNEISLAKLESLKNGESYTYSYEASTYVLSNENNENNKTYGTISIVSSDGQLNENIETIKNNIKSAELKVRLFETESREIKWHSESGAPSLITIENLTEQVQQNVQLKIMLVKNLNLGKQGSQIENMFSFVGFEDRVNIVNEGTNSSEQSVVTLNISSINSKETIIIGFTPYTSDIEEKENIIEMYFEAQTMSGKTYTSNSLIRNIYNITHDFDIEQKIQLNDGTDIDYSNDVLEDGEIIKLTATIYNKENDVFYPSITYEIDKAIEIQSVKTIIENNESDITSTFSTNSLKIDNINIGANEKIRIVVIGKINAEKTTERNVTNIFDVTDSKIYKNKVSSISFMIDKKEPSTNVEPKVEPGIKIDEQEGGAGIAIIEPKKDNEDDIDDAVDNRDLNDDDDIIDNQGNKKDETDSGNTDNQKDSEKNENTDNKKDEPSDKNNSSKITYNITGTAWIDKNKDGKKAASEQILSGMEVGALDAYAGTIVTTTKTDANGKYTLNVPQGNYIVIFYYNDELYTLTTYQVEGATDSENSNAVTKTFIINNESVLVGATDSLKVNNNLADINIGLVNRSKFELKIEKYVSRVVVSNSAGTKTYDQKDNVSLAKVEIKAKNLQNSLVVIEYKIKVTNTGDVEGYAKNIVDYLPTGLNFNSTMNKDWYKSGNNLNNTSLANTKIRPGETKELTLIVTKTMTENNTGLINNKAEINSSSNSLRLENESKNKASADVIISVSTGALISYISCTISIFLVAVMLAFFINKKKLFNEKR